MKPDRNNEPTGSTDTTLENMLGLIDATMQHAGKLQGEGDLTASLFLANAACEALACAVDDDLRKTERLFDPAEELVTVGCVEDWVCDL